MESVPQFFRTGPSPQARLFFFSLLSIFLMIADLRFESLHKVRQAIGAVLYPLQKIALAPTSLYDQVETLIADLRLTKEINYLRQQYFLFQQQLSRLQILEEENTHLRRLLSAAKQTEVKSIMAEILYIPRDPFRRRIILNRGSSDGIEAGQVVVDDLGVIGQITQIFPWSAEVTLITDKNHAVPIQVARNGLRSVISGIGSNNELELRYLPINADIQVNDLLVTSGIGGIYPPGLPVARIEKIEHDRSYNFSRITCIPIAGVERNRHVLILSMPLSEPESTTKDNAIESKS